MQQNLPKCNKNIDPKGEYGKSFWDSIANKYDGDGQIPYVKQFVNLLSPHSSETLLDIGCGTGLLAMSMHNMCQKIICLDYSSGMLEVINNKIAQEEQIAGVRPNIVTYHLAWDDDWNTIGLSENSVDIAYASRSLCTDNIIASIDKMDLVASHMCAVTMSVHETDKCRNEIHQYLGRSTKTEKATAILSYLMEKGKSPHLEYIYAGTQMPCENRDMLISVLRDIAKPKNESEHILLERLIDNEAWIDDNRMWRLDVLERGEWAFIWWFV